MGVLSTASKKRSSEPMIHTVVSGTSAPESMIALTLWSWRSAALMYLLGKQAEIFTDLCSFFVMATGAAGIG